MLPSNGCDEREKPADRESCTQRRCPLADESKPTDNAKPVTAAPPAPKKEGKLIKNSVRDSKIHTYVTN